MGRATPHTTLYNNVVRIGDQRRMAGLTEALNLLVQRWLVSQQSSPG